MTAVKAAKEVCDPAIGSCALAYRSCIPSTKGANGRARVLLTEALENISVAISPATVAWIAAQHAEEARALVAKPKRWHHGYAPRKHSVFLILTRIAYGRASLIRTG